MRRVRSPGIGNPEVEERAQVAEVSGEIPEGEAEGKQPKGRSPMSSVTTVANMAIMLETAGQRRKERRELILPKRQVPRKMRIC